jgi:hypothetical protein
MERSEIRGQPIPDYAALHPGYKAATRHCACYAQNRTALISLGIPKLVVLSFV